MKYKILVVGSGGREHALAKKLASSSQVYHVSVAPGNPGMPEEWTRLSFLSSGGKTALEDLADQAKRSQIDLVVIGPDQTLAEGAVDIFSKHGLLAFGPSAAAAQIEASKSFAKEVMIQAGVPTAAYQRVTSLQESEEVLKNLKWPPESSGWVVKADGLALGKGVQVCQTLSEGLQAARELISISGTLIIEEVLIGEEISWMAFCDGERCALLEPARDYKRLGNGNSGPNTGGMGAISPVPGLPQGLDLKIEQEVFLPTLREMHRRGIPFRGLLYAGLMFNPQTQKFWVLEFNARFGDPETQVLLPRMKDDLFDWCLASARGDLTQFPSRVGFHSDAAVFVVAAAGGYPAQPNLGKFIQFRDECGTDRFYFSGVKKSDSSWVTSGGRVLGALGQGPTLDFARKEAYHWIGKVQFEGIQFRTDIGKSELK